MSSSYQAEADRRRSADDRSDPPEHLWGGRPITVDDVINAGGDYRDWFNVDMRIQAHLRAEGMYRLARRRRKTFNTGGWDFGQQLIVGRMGSKKSALASYIAYYWYQRGHPVFSNGSFLFGRKVEGAELYDIVAKVPHDSLIFVDEAHGTFESAAATTTGVRAWEIQSAGLRKLNCKIVMASAMAKMIAPAIRQECDTLLRPRKINVESESPWRSNPPSHSDPRNFMMAWDVWGGYPFQGADLVGGAGKSTKGGLGKPDSTKITRNPNAVRNAYLLTDSFVPVDMAHAQLYARRGEMDAARDGAAGGKINPTKWGPAHQNLVQGIIDYDLRQEKPEWVKASTLAPEGVSDVVTGKMLNYLFGGVNGAHNSKRGWNLPLLIQAAFREYTTGGGDGYEDDVL